VSASDRRRLLLASAIFALAVGFAAARVGFLTEAGGVRLGATWVMTDFYSAAYYPARAVLAGQTPYDRDASYPPYAPTYLLVHLPFALLSPGPAGIAYFLFTVLLTLGLAPVALRLTRVKPDALRVLTLAGAVLLSRPGHWSLLLGQPAILLTTMAYLAFLYGKTRPALGGWALSATLLKPTYGVPITLLLWAWGRRRTVALGLGLAALLNLPLIALLAALEGGLGQLLRAALSGHQKFQDYVNPATNPTRTDATSLISRFVGVPLSTLAQVLLAAGVLLLSATVLRLLAKHATQNADALAIGIICLATSLVAYHQGYDLVLLSAPFLAAAMPSSLSGMPRGLRATLVVLFSILALNWITTASVLEAWQPPRPLWLALTSINGFCLVALFLAYLTLGIRYHIRTRWWVLHPRAGIASSES
jgi:hypothetical protein